MLTPTILIGLVVTATIATALVKHRDTFHPAVLLCPMLGFHYCYSPLMLEADDGFTGYLWDSQVERAQWVHFAGVLTLCIGLLWGSKRGATRPLPPSDPDDRFDRTRLIQGSLLLGFLGLASFVYGINYVGGFGSAYGVAYGGGFSESGWVRDLTLLCLPASLLLTVSHRGGRATWRELVLALLFVSPFLIHGLLGARRGPTFMGLAGPAMLFYIARGKRPSLPTLALGGVLLGILLLSLVANRQSVYWGSDIEVSEAPSSYFRPSAGNDFIYGAGLIIVTEDAQNFTWGTTYLVTLLVRPIPRSIWPTKYLDAAEFLNRPNLEENLGIDIKSFQSVLGWTAALGAAPGLVGDMWREFSWAMLVALAAIGAFYGYVWRRAVMDRGNWLPTYCLLASLSIYLVMQTLEAMLYRFLFSLVPMLVVLRYARRNAPQRTLMAYDRHALSNGPAS